MFILRTAFISSVLFINNNIGDQALTEVSGLVIKKINKPAGGRTPAIYRLMIKAQEGTTFNLTTTKTLVQNYKVGEIFSQQMNKGSLGFYYLRE